MKMSEIKDENKEDIYSLLRKSRYNNLEELIDNLPSILLEKDFRLDEYDLSLINFLGDEQRHKEKTDLDESVEVTVFCSYFVHQLKKEGLSENVVNAFRQTISPLKNYATAKNKDKKYYKDFIIANLEGLKELNNKEDISKVYDYTNLYFNSLIDKIPKDNMRKDIKHYFKNALFIVDTFYRKVLNLKNE